MIDHVGTTDVTVARVIVGHANVIGERETEAHVHAKRSRINRCERRAECCSAWLRQASSRHSFVAGNVTAKPRNPWQWNTTVPISKTVARLPVGSNKDAFSRAFAQSVICAEQAMGLCKAGMTANRNS